MIRILLTLIFFSCAVAPSFAVVITFQANALIDGAQIKLGDLVKFDEQSELVDAMASLAVGKSPAPGEKIFLRSLNIKKYLETNHNLPQNIYWKGSPNVAIVRNGKTIGAEKIQSLISDYIEEHKANLPKADIRFIPHSLPIPFKVPVGVLSHEVIPSSPAIIGSSRFSLIFRVDNRVVKNMSVRGKLEALTEVVITAKNLKRGQILNSSHLTSSILDISDLPDAGLNADDLIGMKLKKNLRSGTPMKLSYVEPLPVIHRGQKVKIVIKTSSMLLSATGLAHNDGQLNQVIKVQNLSSHKILFCRVAAPGLVEVML